MNTRTTPTGIRQKRCNQCWTWRGLMFFAKAGGGGHYRDCVYCREDRSAADRERRSGVRRRRQSLRDAGADGVLFTARSGNKKLGPIPATIVAAGTCPPSCPWWGRGCYAEAGLLGSHWARAGTEGLSWGEFIRRVCSIAPGALWRHAVAGDLPGAGERLDVLRFQQLAFAAFQTRGFSFTHKPLDEPDEAEAVRAMNASAARMGGLTVNLSANDLEHADALAERRLGPVAVVLPEDFQGPTTRTPAGRKVVLCPAQRSPSTCASCGLCAKADRRAIIGFRAHGQGAAIVSSIVRKEVA